MKDVNWTVFPPTQVEKKIFQKKGFKKKSKPFSNTHKNSTPTKTHQPANQTQANFRSRNHGVSHCRIWMGHHFGTPRPCKQCPPAMQKCIHMNQWISHIAKCRKTWFWGKQIQQTRAAPKLCHTEGLHPMANTNGIATSSSPGLQKLGILCLEQPNSWKETTSQTSNLATTAFWWTTIAKFLWDTQGTGMQNTVPTPFWQPEMTQNVEICKKIALLWTGLPFNTGFMAPLKSPPSSLKM